VAFDTSLSSLYLSGASHKTREQKSLKTLHLDFNMNALISTEETTTIASTKLAELSCDELAQPSLLSVNEID
jgi:hypothetical protein